MKRTMQQHVGAKISPEGNQWLVEALDPYHDNQLRLVGLPDLMSSPSVVQMHNQSYTLTAPASAAGDWDATVAFTGCLSTIGVDTFVKKHAAANNYFHHRYDHTSFSGVEFGSFIVRAGDKTTPLPVYEKLDANDTYEAFGGCLQAKNGDRCRLIGVAFEITNTTAEIYKQGSITVAQLPGPVSDTGVIQYLDTYATPYSARQTQAWYAPVLCATRSDLLAIPGSGTWAAKDGVYAIPRMFTHTMLCDSPQRNGRAAIVQASTSDTVFGSTSPTGVMTDTTSYPDFYGVAATGFCGLQAFLTGLSHETSLTITFRTIVEYFPCPSSGLLPLAVPSPAYDPKAFAYYSAIVREAPYAVTVKENGIGDYFRRILAIASRAGELLAPLGGPYAPVISGFSGAGKLLASYLEERAQKKQISDQVVRSQHKPLPSIPVRKKEAGSHSAPTRR